MIKELMNKLNQSKTADELLSYKAEIFDAYNSLNNKLEKQNFNVVSYYDIKSMHDLDLHMNAYYGPSFYKKCAVPFLEKQNPKTIDIIEFSVLFYTLQIIELLEDGFWDRLPLCVYPSDNQSELFDHVDIISLTSTDRYSKNLFMSLWYCFMRMLNMDENKREFSFCHENSVDVFYLSDDVYSDILEMIYKNYKDSDYSVIIHRILGVYRIRFTEMDYILNHQSLFIDVAYKYLCSLL